MPRPGRFTLGQETRYALYRRLRGPQGLWKFAENVTPTGIQSPDLPARGKSLYRLSYGGPLFLCKFRCNLELHAKESGGEGEICDSCNNW